MTEYYCNKCKDFFTEEGLPNINRIHKCGELARVIRHKGGETNTEED